MNKFFFAIVLLLVGACQLETSPPKETIPTVTTNKTISPTAVPRTLNHTLTTPTCTLSGKILKHNKVWLSQQKRLVSISADSTTYHPKFGDSHRKLTIYNSANCNQLFDWTLPINTSPDFPYYLADLTYNKNSHLVAIKGHRTIHCLDLNTNKILPSVRPSFTSNRVAQDAQSGALIRLELWEDFLIGYAQDMGAFVFKIEKNSSLQPVLPYAEHQVFETHFNSLFLIRSKGNKTQAILPQYDWDTEQFSIHPVFTEPVNLDKNIVKSALNNRFIILRTQQQDQVVAIDMKAAKEIPLSKELQTKKTSEIVDWMKKNMK